MTEIKAEMSGTAWKILVKLGDEVQAGDELAILESMKMEIPIETEIAGRIHTIYKNEGDFVNEGETLIEIES
ncbi:acetyl-CoA carboxylase biotin carboxyl carrier protein subunit [Salicibibacter cibarius]|uniref:Acetyl-CoA carboxylase biotin carboxyl carrier protein subunit n=1 Tax=Salicibibacter cibarius TaxID=2743000 RepID=A0A7T6Z463_9BACI|nr:acetyl-CoA carboxylase biotin carboxyl carrier protein subunit [Salicibibacter cibarius]QQK76561.1 acetyl-CoA carboxylase biotin carboxyl carrier protein subunit [Salicibibacter cibarius]